MTCIHQEQGMEKMHQHLSPLAIKGRKIEKI